MVLYEEEREPPQPGVMKWCFGCHKRTNHKVKGFVGYNRRWECYDCGYETEEWNL
jgi:hypothetical protein